MLFAVDLPAVRLRPRRLFVVLCVALLLPLSLAVTQAHTIRALATDFLTHALTTRIPRIALKPSNAFSGVIVLGGRSSRVHEAIALSKRFPDLNVILSGPDDSERAVAEAHLNNVLIDDRPRNTFENATYSRALSPSPDEGCWLLVTSAIHMPRAVAVFSAAGIPVAPWPVFDTLETVDKQAGRVRHEVLGLIAYRLLGRTREFYPEPEGAMCPSGPTDNPVRITSAQ
jgi:uncharacterized SAM-binding protein YcdF (DUF218 family)